MNYLILVHKCPNQLLRLVKRLDTDNVHFFIHVDKNSDINQFKLLLPEYEHLHYVPDEERVYGRWGDLSLVDAAFSCMRLALKYKVIGHCVLLSGQDYPLRSSSYINEYLNSHLTSIFLSVYPIPDPKKKSENGGYERLISYTFDCKNPHDGRMKAKIQPLSLRIKTLLGFYRILRYRRDILLFAICKYFQKRIYPHDLAQTFNEFWCVLTIDAIRFLIETWDGTPNLREYYKYTHIPDETIFSAILMANEKFKSQIHPMCHYINWDEAKDGSPKTLTESDWENINQQLKEKPYILFARKFDDNATILDIIDKKLIKDKNE